MDHFKGEGGCANVHYYDALSHRQFVFIAFFPLISYFCTRPKRVLHDMDVRFYFDSLSLASWARIHDVIGALVVFFYFPQGSLLLLLLFCSIFLLERRCT